MPPLNIQDAPIQAATSAGRARPVHPSPTRDGLALEVLSPRELGWWGQRFGIDTPYLMAPLGWGEMEPVYAGGVAEIAQERGLSFSLPITQFSLLAGPAVPPDPPGDVDVQPQVFDFPTPTLVWTVPHNLGRMPAAVAVYIDSMLRQVPLNYPDNNTVVARFSTEQAGTVVVI